MSLPSIPSSHRTADVRRSPRRTWWRTVVGAAAAVFLAVSGTTLAGGPANATAPADAAAVHADAVHADATSAQCLTVKVQSSFWQDGPDSGGVFRDIAITNSCTTAVTGWKLVFVLPPGQTFQQGWNATWTVDGKILTATPAAWNGTIASGQSIEIGYIGTWAGNRQEPDCTINGQACDGTDPGPDPGPTPGPTPGPVPTVAMTSPIDGSNLVSVCAIRLTADASTPVGTIDRVEFHLNNQLVGSDTSAPYGIDVPPDHPALRGSARHGVFARVVTVSPAATADSAPVGFMLVAPPPALMVIACPSSVQVPAGGSATMEFTLRACGATPGLNLTVTGDAGIRVTPLVLPPGSREHRIIITADPGTAGAVARITANPDSGHCMPASAQITVVPPG